MGDVDVSRAQLTTLRDNLNMSDAAMLLLMEVDNDAFANHEIITYYQLSLLPFFVAEHVNSLSR